MQDILVKDDFLIQSSLLIAVQGIYFTDNGLLYLMGTSHGYNTTKHHVYKMLIELIVLYQNWPNFHV
jgi:hypothetical protein